MRVLPIIRLAILAVCSCAALGTQSHAHVPAWWAENGVVPASSDQESAEVIDMNYQPALLGQAKHMAYQAWQAMETIEPGSAGPRIEAIVNAFSQLPEDNYQVLLIGQLKAIAEPFYERFAERGFDVSLFDILLNSASYPYPWVSPDSPGYDYDINYQPANLGQLKYLFSFGLDAWQSAPVLRLDDLSAYDRLPETPSLETNLFGIILSGTIQCPAFDSLSINGNVVPSVTFTGPFSFNHPLDLEGENLIRLELRDLSGQTVEHTITVIRITQGPQLTVQLPDAARITTRTPAYELVGEVGDSAVQLLINDQPVEIAQDRIFRHLITLQEGDNPIVFSASDALGNTTTLQRLIRLDSIPPAFESLSLQDGWVTNNPSLSVSGRFSEPVVMFINGTPVEIASADGWSFEHPVLLVDGENSLVISVADAIGNTHVQTLQVFLDSIAPVLHILSPAAGLKTGDATIVIRGETDDPSASLSVNGAELASSGTSFEFTHELQPGDNTIGMTAVDSAGNSSSASVNVFRDVEAPLLSSCNLTDQQVFASPRFVISGQSDDPDASISIRLNGEPVDVDALAGSFVCPLSWTEGTNHVELTLSDAFGDQTILSYTIQLDSSTQAPMLDPLPEWVAADRLALVSGLAEPDSVVLVSGGLSSLTLNAGADGRFSGGPLLLNPNAANNLSFKAQDPLGNTATSFHRVTSDTIRPSITLDTPLEGAVYPDSLVPVSGHVLDANPGATVSVNGSPIPLASDGSFSTVLTLNPGASVIVCSTTDRAGNAASDVLCNVSVVPEPEDTTPPYIQVLSPAAGAVLPGPDITLVLRISDASGVQALSINGAPADISSMNPDGLLSLPLTLDASGRIEIQASDGANPPNSATVVHQLSFDDGLPAAPVVRLVSPSSPGNTDSITLYLQIGPNLRYRVSGGAIPPVSGIAPASGQFTLDLPVSRNITHSIEIAAIAASGLESVTSLEWVQDSVAPFVVSMAPLPSDPAVSVDAPIALTFSEPMKRVSTLPLSLLGNGTPIPFAANWSADATTLTITPAQSFIESSPIELTLLPTWSDHAGNSLTGPRSFAFKVGDFTAPDAPTELQAARTKTREPDVLLTGKAEPNATIHVEGGAAVASGTADAEGNFELRVPLLPNQLNTLLVSASDAAGNESEPVTVEVDHLDTPLSLRSVTPSGESVPVDAAFELVFDRPLDPATLSGLSMTGHGLGIIPCAIAPGESPGSCTITPNAPLAFNTAHEIIIPLSLHDLYGNSIPARLAVAFSTETDNTAKAPIIHSWQPQDVTNQSTLTITGYSDPGTVITVHGAAHEVVWPESGTVDGTGDFTCQVTLRPNAENTITLTAAYPDGDPSVPSAPIVITHDSVPPEVLTVSPKGNQVPVSSIVSVCFSEAVNPAAPGSDTSAIRLLDSGNHLVPGNWTPSPDNSIHTFYPDHNFVPLASYTLVVDADVHDMAGNSFGSMRSWGFTTAAQASGPTNLIDPPVINPPGFERTTQSTVTYTGTAQPNSTVFILGGREQVSVSTDADGNFSAVIPLIPDSTNQLVAFVQKPGEQPGMFASFSMKHTSHETGIRIMTPLDGSESNNRSIIVSGILDNPEDFKRVFIEHAINGEPQTDDASVMGLYFARQVVLEPFDLLMLPQAASVDAMPTSGNRLLVIADVAGSLQFRFFDPQGVPTDYSETDLLDFSLVEQVEPSLAGYQSQSAILEGLDDPETPEAPVDSAVFIREFLQPVWALDAYSLDQRNKVSHMISLFLRHPVDEGELHLTVKGELTNGSILSSDVSFSLFIEPATTDSRPPRITFLHPEPGDVVSEEVIETMMVVEEGASLQSVFIDNVAAHSQVGNFSFIYYRPSQQGENTITAVAKDFYGHESSQSVSIFCDSVPAGDHTVDMPASDILGRDIPLYTSRVITLTGTGEPGSIIHVLNGFINVQTTVGADGTYSILVPLLANQRNSLVVVSADAAGNISNTTQIELDHDDAAPFVVSSDPSRGQKGVPLNASISILFSEPLDPLTVDSSTVTLSRVNAAINAGEPTPIPAYKVLLSADGRTISIRPDYDFNRGETIHVRLSDDIRDLNNRRMLEAHAFSFDTALYRTMLSGVVLDTSIRPLSGIKVGIKGTDIVQYTSSFGTFILDQLPKGEQVLFVDARPDKLTGASPQGDSRVFDYLEYPVFIELDSDNTLGRPIFMVDTDFSTALDLQTLTDGLNDLVFESTRSDLSGFQISCKKGDIRFPDGTDRGQLTITRIDPAYIPDRLPSGAIPHFMVRIGPEDMSFARPVSLHFPNTYNLKPGDEVSIFHFRHGMAGYRELAKVQVDADGFAVSGPVLSSPGYIGFVPVNGADDYSRAYLEGRVVDGNGIGIPGVSVNAITASSFVFTDALGYYRIPLPEVRIFEIQTFATISTRLSGDDKSSPDLVYPSEIVELKTSGTTRVPDIVIDSFTLSGNIRFFDSAGTRLGLTGFATDDSGRVTAIDPTHAREVDIFVYRQLDSNESGVATYDTEPYLSTRTDLGTLLDSTFDASYQARIFGSLTDGLSASPAPKPGDTLKIVAFDRRTGFYGESAITLAMPSNDGSGASNVIRVDVDLYPPILTVGMNRVFHVDGIRRREAIPHRGIVFTSDEYVEFKSNWRTVACTPLSRSEISLPARLRVDSIDYKTDYHLGLKGGSHFNVLEIREALFPSRLEVLQRETDVGREWFSVSRDGSFLASSLIPIQVRMDDSGDDASIAFTYDPSADSTRDVLLYVIDLAVAAGSDGMTSVSGRSLPGDTVNVAGHTYTADSRGYFGDKVQMGSTGGGFPVSLEQSESTMYGLSYVPVLESLTPDRGSQGDTVIISGVNFSPIPDDNKVTFAGVPAQVLGATRLSLSVRVPSDASSGMVHVSVGGQRSNGLFFEFVSLGINNGSFESGDLRAFTPEGSAAVVEAMEQMLPTHRRYMALLDTNRDPVSGVASLTTDPFMVNDLGGGTAPWLTFDYCLMSTVVPQSLDQYLKVYVIRESGDTVQLHGVVPVLNSFPVLRLCGYDKGSMFRTASVNLAAAGVAVHDTIRLRVELRGRGRLPSFIPGTLVDDVNPIDSAKSGGTALLLDNFRLEVAPPVMEALRISDLTAPSVSTVAGERRLSFASSQLLPEGARIFVASLHTGAIRSFDVESDGSWMVALPEQAFAKLLNPSGDPGGERFGHMVLWYALGAGGAGSGQGAGSYVSDPVELKLRY